MGLKLMFKKLITKKLESYVKKYFRKHPEVKLVVVAGSVGKTSTKMAIGTVLSQHFRVRMHEGNHNAILSSPVAILGVDYPGEIRNPLAWLIVFKAARMRIKQPTDVDVIVQELGSDRIGEVPHYGKYLKPDIAVITAVSPEHMEYFYTIDNVAREELSAANYSRFAIINRDDINESFSKYLKNANINTYGTSKPSEYRFDGKKYTAGVGYSGKYFAPEISGPVDAVINVLGQHSLRPVIAAMAVATKLGESTADILSGVSKLSPVPGRMNVLKGFENTMIIDDSYNSSPLAVKCAIQTLCELTSAPQRIAVLGSMNELGKSSNAEHTAVGALCKPADIEWVITVGDKAKQYIAPAAKDNGCKIKCFDDAVSAGIFVRSVMEPEAAILFKGSEGGIYLEEAIKMVLDMDSDEVKLVRQSAEWLDRKQAFFDKLKK